MGTPYLLTASQDQTTASLTIGTLKLSSTSTSAQTLGLAANNMQLGGGTTSTPGAILIDGTASWNITGTGALAANTPATSPDLIFQHYGTGTLTVNAPIGGGVTSLVKAGPGTMVLAGTNTFTGDIALNGGVLSFGAVGNVAGGLGAGREQRQLDCREIEHGSGVALLERGVGEALSQLQVGAIAGGDHQQIEGRRHG